MNLLKIQGPYCNSPKKNLPANSIRLSNKEQDINKAIKKLTSSSSFWSCTALKPTYNVPPPCKRKISGETQKIRATNHSIKRENKTEVKRNGEKGEETSLHAGRNARERDKTQVILKNRVSLFVCEVREMTRISLQGLYSGSWQQTCLVRLLKLL